MIFVLNLAILGNSVVVIHSIFRVILRTSFRIYSKYALNWMVKCKEQTCKRDYLHSNLK